MEKETSRVFNMSLAKDLLRNLPEAIEIVRNYQKFPPLSQYQKKMFEFMVMKFNSANQLPTGSGKTYPPICLPLVLDVLRENFGHTNIPASTRTLYIVPLINIFHSIVAELRSLNIPYQVIEAGSISVIDRDAKVILISPEKLLNNDVMKSILQLSWSVIVVDEPHLALLWGTSKAKRKPFRKALADLSKMNELGTVFECHSATIEDFNKLYSFFGRKNSLWKKQIRVPDRPNLTYYLLKGAEAPVDILQLSCVRNVLDNEYSGMTLVYVQRVTEGAEIFFSLLDYCEKNKLITYSPLDKLPSKPFAFLHAKLSEETKKTILSDSCNGLVKVLIATSSAGCGINLPVKNFVGWGLDPEPSGLIQASGRTARKPMDSTGSVLWVHNSALHGRRVPAVSKVRDLLKTDRCLRQVMNGWFSHGEVYRAEMKVQADLCCSNCMLECDCETCNKNLSDFSKDKDNVADVNLASKKLAEFLRTLNLNDEQNTSVFLNEDSLATEIVSKLKETEDMEEIQDFLSAFSLSEEQCSNIGDFLKRDIKMTRFSKKLTNMDADFTLDDDSDLDTDSSSNSVCEEYFDSDCEEV